jgi:hypothetical protein
MRLLTFRGQAVHLRGRGRLPIVALNAALVLFAVPVHAQAQAHPPPCGADGRNSAGCRSSRPIPGARMVVAGATLFSLGYTLPILFGGIGIVGCASGRAFDCPLMLSFLPIVGMPAGVAWRASVAPPPPPGTVDDGLAYLFIGALTFSTLQLVGGILAIAGIVRERRAILHGERVETRRWALLPGPSAIGLSLAIVSP